MSLGRFSGGIGEGKQEFHFNCNNRGVDTMSLSKEFREAQMSRLRDIENQNKYDEFICKFDDYQRNAGKGSGELSVREDLENNFAKYGVFYQPGYLAREVCRFNLNPRSSDFPKDYDGVVNLVNSLNGQTAAVGVSTPASDVSMSVPGISTPATAGTAPTAPAVGTSVSSVTASAAATTPEAAVSPITALPNNMADTDVFGGTQLGRKGLYSPTESDISDEERRFHDNMKYRNLGNLSREERINVTNTALEAAQNPNFTPYPSVPSYPYDEKTSQCLRPRPLMQCLEPWEDVVQRYKGNSQNYKQADYDMGYYNKKADMYQGRLRDSKDCQKMYLYQYDQNTPEQVYKAALHGGYDMFSRIADVGGMTGAALEKVAPVYGQTYSYFDKGVDAADVASDLVLNGKAKINKVGAMFDDSIVNPAIDILAKQMSADNYLVNPYSLYQTYTMPESCQIDSVNNYMTQNISDFRPADEEKRTVDDSYLPTAAVPPVGASSAISSPVREPLPNNIPEPVKTWGQSKIDAASPYAKKAFEYVSGKVKPVAKCLNADVVSAKLGKKAIPLLTAGGAMISGADKALQRGAEREQMQAFTDAYVDENRKKHRDVQDAYNRAAYKKQLYGEALDNSMEELNRKTGSSYKFNRY